MAGRKKGVLTKARREAICRTDVSNRVWAEGKVAQAVDYLTDRELEKRGMLQQCRACFYFPHPYLAGQMFTDWSCRICGQPQPKYPNTAVPCYCGDCARKYKLCVRCGGSDR